MPQIQLFDDRGSSRLTPLLDPCIWQTSLSDDSPVTLEPSVKVQSGERGRDRRGLTLCLSIIVIHPDSCELRMFGDIIGEVLFRTTSMIESDIASASREVFCYVTGEGKGGGKGVGTDFGVWFLVPSLQVQQSYDTSRDDPERMQSGKTQCGVSQKPLFTAEEIEGRWYDRMAGRRKTHGG
jgi:hypothetical protein